MEEKMRPDEQLAADLNRGRAAQTGGRVLEGAGAALAAAGVLLGGQVVLIVLGIVLCGIGAVIVSSRRKTIKQQLGDRLIRGVLGEVLSEVDYRPHEGVSSGMVWDAHLQLPEAFSGVTGSDHVRAVYKGLPVELSDITLVREEDTYDEATNTWRTEEKTVFRGQWLTCDFGKTLSAEVQLSPRTRVQRLLRTESIRTENENFNRRFNIRSESEHEAFSILTPHMMEYILSMAEKSGGDVYMGFQRGGRLNIAVQSDRDFFELGKGRVDVAALRQKFLGEIRWFTDLIDELRLVDTFYRAP